MFCCKNVIVVCEVIFPVQVRRVVVGSGGTFLLADYSVILF